MGTGTYRRRSTSSRARVMPDKQAHAVVGHLLRVQAERDLTEAQDRFLGVLIAELVHRRREAPWRFKCRCRVCAPAEPMGMARTGAQSP